MNEETAQAALLASTDSLSGGDAAQVFSNYDVVVVGGGAAGLSAALVLSRARRRVLVVDGAAPRNAPAAHMHGYLSRDGMPPANLLAAGRGEVSCYGGKVVTDTVADVAASGTDERPNFWLTMAGGCRITARRLLVATGLRDELPDIPGLRDRWARDVLHCPYCHGVGGPRRAPRCARRRLPGVGPVRAPRAPVVP